MAEAGTMVGEVQRLFSRIRSWFGDGKRKRNLWILASIFLAIGFAPSLVDRDEPKVSVQPASTEDPSAKVVPPSATATTAVVVETATATPAPPTPTDTPRPPTATATPRPDVASLGVGSTIVSDGFRLTLLAVEDPLQTSTRPDGGYRFIGYQFSVENTSGSRRDFWGSLDFKFIDAERYEYDSGYASTERPELSQCPHTLSAGGKCEGWIFTEVRATGRIIEVRYEGDANRPGAFTASR